MALKGEGDPRWVVREREDGRNVNGWHWEDKDVSAWASSRIKSLLTDPICSADASDGVRVVVEAVESVDGDATLFNRKGVLRVLYDLKISGKWTSTEEEKDARTSGDFKFELFDEDPEISVSIDSKSKAVPMYKKLFTEKISPVFVKQCRVFIKEMHAGAGLSLDGLSLPTKKKVTETKVTDFLRSGMDKPAKRETKKADPPLVIQDVFTCSKDDLYLGLTDLPRLEAITRAKAVSEPRVGGRYMLMQGTVQGEYVSATKGEEIKMKWRMKKWDSDVMPADVRMQIVGEDDGKTRLVVTLSNVPSEERKSTEGFWRMQIFQAMKVVMGWGSASQFLY